MTQACAYKNLQTKHNRNRMFFIVSIIPPKTHYITYISQCSSATCILIAVDYIQRKLNISYITISLNTVENYFIIQFCAIDTVHILPTNCPTEHTQNCYYDIWWHAGDRVDIIFKDFCFKIFMIFDFLIKIKLHFQIYHSTRHEERFTTSRCLDAKYTQCELI
jgi:hypothetical protein